MDKLGIFFLIFLGIEAIVFILLLLDKNLKTPKSKKT